MMSKRNISRASRCLGAILVLQLSLASSLAAQTPRVSVAPMVRKSLRQPVEQAAILLPYARIRVSSKVTGFVSEVHVDIGDRVTKGDLLVAIDVPEHEAELAAAEARVKSADAYVSQARASVRLQQVRYDLTRSLFEKRGRTRFQLEEADAELKLAEAAVAAAEAKKVEAEANVQKLRVLVGFGTIKAAFSGVISERNVDLGALVRGGLDGNATEMLTLERDDRLRCRIEIPERDAKLVLSAYGRGTLALELNLEASGEMVKLQPGKLSGGAAHFALSLHPRSHHMLAEIELDNSALNLRPGYFGKAKFDVSGGEAESPGFVIPNTALRAPRKGRPHVFVVSKSSVEQGVGIVERLNVTPGTTDGREIEVTPEDGSSLKDKWVVVRGAADLQGGEKVSIGGVK